MRTKSFAGILPVLLALSMQLPAYSQTYVTQVKPFGSDLWGYANQKGEMVISAQYTKCFEFSPEGYAAVSDPKTKQYYFINLKGERLSTEVSEYKLLGFLGFSVKGFCDGMAAINQDKLWGFLNTAGKVAIPVKYDDVTEFCDGYATAKIGTTYYVLNTKGEQINVDAPGIADMKQFSEELAPFRNAGKQWGYIGKDGKIAIKEQFESVGYFRDGIAWAKISGGLCGYINPKGEWVIKPQFTEAKAFDHESGLARVRTADKWAYVNRAGEITYVTESETWGDFSEGLADGKKNDKKGFYNNKGQWVIQPQFENTRDFKNGFAAVKQGGKWGFIDKEGKWVIQPIYENVKDLELVK